MEPDERHRAHVKGIVKSRRGKNVVRPEHLSDKSECRSDIRCGEEYPPDVYKYECCAHAYELRDLFKESLGKPFDDHEHSVKRSPEYEGPVRTVPESAYDEDREHVKVGPDLALSVSAEGKIDVFAKEGCERYMPSLPEIPYRISFIGRIEVLRDIDVEHPGHACCHIAVTRKIEIYLKCICDRAEPSFRHGKVTSHHESVSSRSRKPRCKKKLFTHSDRKPHKARRDVLGIGYVSFMFVYLRNKLILPCDGAHYHPGEEPHVFEIVQNPDGSGLSAV